MNIIEDKEIKRLYLDLKGYERDFQSISPKVVELRNKIKEKIRQTQLKINAIREKNNIPL